ncbi:MAG: hypothetical protein Q4G67_01320 [Actinomycetia bacterium]|nr:hypothetical protein [Actinomycetes bacterium]
MRREPLTGWRAGRSILRAALAAGLVGVPVFATIAWAIAGENAALSALLAAVVVLVVISLGLVGISVVVAGEPGLSMAGAAVVYIGQILLIVAALLVLRDREWMHGHAFALAAIGQVLLMQVAQVLGYRHGRHELDLTPAEQTR